MLLRWVPLGILLAASCSPAQTERGPGHYVDKVTINGTEREYILRIPKGYKPGTRTPVVIALHGLSGNMNYFSSVTGIEDVADQEGFICAIPNGLSTNMRGWNTGFFAMAGTTSDTDFITKILDNIDTEFTTDKKREYVFGHSNGAMMAYYLGGLMSDRLAAVAGIAGTIGIPKATTSIKEVPVPKNPISVLMIHGEKDPMVAYKPGAQSLLQCTGAEDGAKWWAQQDGCNPTPTVTDFVKDYATLTDYKNGKSGTEVRLISTLNGTHEIPGAHLANGRETASGVDAIKEIWAFFKSHPKK
ncbi:MAG: hypothetical protein JST12_04435 [Armatimonadetes bacterium]|nr:hypothetical protein [Armatimonadota bacterium]